MTHTVQYHKHFSLLAWAMGCLFTWAAGFSPLATCPDDPNCNQLRPDYRLVDLGSSDFETACPNVSALAWHPDGRLIVVEWSKGGIKSVVNRQFNGTIYLLDGVPEAEGPDDVDVTVWKEQLEIPTGVVVLGDTVYVSSGFTLDGHVDTDGDDRADAVHEVFDFGYEDKCRHEFFMGLVYQEGYFYASASRCKDDPDRPSGSFGHTWQMHEGRGAWYKISRITGDAELLAGGLRQPNGMGVGPENQIFECDNQGTWLPGSKMVHLQKGKFYGFHADNFTPEEDYGSDFAGVTESPPAVWMPHGVWHSPSHPLLVQEGIFKGQMLVGDMAAGGISHCFLEKVNGEWQGCIIPWSGGFDAGVGAILWGDNGSLIVGGQGIGDNQNWGWQQQKEGLEKIVPIPNPPVVFEPLAVRSRQNGFEIEFTRPLNESAAQNLGNYGVRRYEQRPEKTYGGGNKEDNTAVNISSANLSEDKKSVFLEINISSQIYRSGSLQPNTVVDFTLSDGNSGLVSSTGDQLWTNIIQYTLNSVSESQAFDINGCTDDGFEEYNPDATFDDGTCFTPAAGANGSPGAKPSLNFQTMRTNRGTQIYIPFSGTHQLTVRNSRGEIMRSFKGNAPGFYSLSGDMPPGIYILELRAFDSVISRSVPLF